MRIIGIESREFGGEGEEKAGKVENAHCCHRLFGMCYIVELVCWLMVQPLGRQTLSKSIISSLVMLCFV